MKNHSPQSPNRNPLLIRSAALLGSLSVLSSGIVLAQTDALVDPVSAPAAPAPRVSAPAPRKAPAPAPRRVSAPAPRRAPAPAQRRAPAPAPRRVSVPKKAAPAPRVSAPAPAPAPRVSAPAPAPRVVAPSPAPRPAFSSPPQTTTPRSEKPQLAAPEVSVPSPSPSRNIPSRLIDRPQQQSAPPTSGRVKFSGNGTSNFVDNLGSSVELTDRSTGCKTVSRNGSLAQGRCGNSSRRASTRAQQTPVSRSPVQRRSQNKLQTRRTNYNPRRTSYNRTRVRPVATRSRYAPQPVPTEQLAFYNQIKRQLPIPGGKTSLQFPLSIPANITSSFGFRIHPILGTRRLHSGTDIAAPTGTPVLAAYNGEVAIADYTGGYGLMVALRHEDGTQESRYAHLSQIFVQPGDLVERGEVIGLVGSTGMSTGPHLHFEWRHLMPSGWTAVDAGVHLEYAMQNLIGGMSAANNLYQPEPHIEVGLDFQPDSPVAAESERDSDEKKVSSRAK